MTWDHPRGYDCLVAASAEYFGQTGVEIMWERRSLQAFADVPIEVLARKYDLVVLDHPHIGQIADSGCLLALPEMAPGASLGGSVECYLWNGRTWAWPIDAACQMAVVRPDLGKAFPRSWDELFAADAHRYRLVTPLLPVDALDTMLTLLASLGEEKLPVSSTHFCSHENGLKALRILKRLHRVGPAEAVTWNPIKVLEVLSGTDDFAGSPCLFGYVNYARPGFREHALRYVDLPVFEGVGLRRAILGGAGIGISSLGNNPQAAQAFASWVTSQDVQAGVYLHNHGQPAHAGAWARHRHNPNFSGFLDGGFETIRTAWTRPRSSWFLPFVDAVCEVITPFLSRDQDEDLFLETVNQLYRHHARCAA